MSIILIIVVILWILPTYSLGSDLGCCQVHLTQFENDVEMLQKKVQDVTRELAGLGFRVQLLRDRP